MVLVEVSRVVGSCLPCRASRSVGATGRPSQAPALRWEPTGCCAKSWAIDEACRRWRRVVARCREHWTSASFSKGPGAFSGADGAGATRAVHGACAATDHGCACPASSCMCAPAFDPSRRPRRSTPSRALSTECVSRARRASGACRAARRARPRGPRRALRRRTPCRQRAQKQAPSRRLAHRAAGSSQRFEQRRIPKAGAERDGLLRARPARPVVGGEPSSCACQRAGSSSSAATRRTRRRRACRSAA